MTNTIFYLHILGLSIWLGSMVTWAMFAPKLGAIDPTKNTTNTLRVVFTRLSWASYSLALVSGIYLLQEVGLLIIAGLIIFLHSTAVRIGTQTCVVPCSAEEHALFCGEHLRLAKDTVLL